MFDVLAVQWLVFFERYCTLRCCLIASLHKVNVLSTVITKTPADYVWAEFNTENIAEQPVGSPKYLIRGSPG